MSETMSNAIPEPETAPVPQHVAIIMDGNGRWAQARGLERVAGHEEGAVSVREIVRACRRQGVRALTLYSFSTENWRRPFSEVTALMALLERYIVGERDEILDNDIRFRAIGQLDRLPPNVREPLEELSAVSHTGRTEMDLCLALSYGGGPSWWRRLARLPNRFVPESWSLTASMRPPLRGLSMRRIFPSRIS